MLLEDLGLSHSIKSQAKTNKQTNKNGQSWLVEKEMCHLPTVQEDLLNLTVFASSL